MTLLSNPIARSWIAYFSMLGGLLAIASHISVLAQIYDLRLADASSEVIIFEQILYPLMAARICLELQIKARFAISALEDQPLLEVRVAFRVFLGLALKHFGYENCSQEHLILGIDILVLTSMVSSSLFGALACSSRIGALVGPTLLTSYYAIADLTIHFCLKFFPKQNEEFKQLLTSESPSHWAHGYEAVNQPGARSTRKWCILFLTIILCQVLFAAVRGFTGGRICAIFDAFVIFGLMYTLSKIFHELIQRYTKASCFSWFWFGAGLYIILTIVIGVILPSLPLDPAGNKILSDDDLGLTGGGKYDETFRPKGFYIPLGQYPVCDWKSPGNSLHASLTVLDAASFAHAPYYGTKEDVEKYMQAAIANTELGRVELESIEGIETVGRLAVFKLPRVKMRVLAFRGTAQAKDWMYNFDLWMPAIAFMVIQQLIPLGTYLPNDIGSYVASVDMRKLFNLKQPWIEKRDKVAQIVTKSNEQGYQVIITGHSLGGGMAQAIGAFFAKPTVGISPVGMTYTQKRVGLEFMSFAVQKAVLSVIPKGDIVPMLDIQSGTVAPIRCTSTGFACHSIKRTICELYHNCGDPRGRKPPMFCDEVIGEDWDSYNEEGIAPAYEIYNLK